MSGVLNNPKTEDSRSVHIATVRGVEPVATTGASFETKNLHPAVIAGLGVAGAGGLALALRKRKFEDLRPSILLDRPRTPEGTFASGETAASPAAMTAAYGPPETRPAPMMNGGVLAAVQKLAKQKQ